MDRTKLPHSTPGGFGPRAFADCDGSGSRLATKGYCAVCGAICNEPFHVTLDGAVVDFCEEHGIAGLGRRVCSGPIVDGLSCALPHGHKGTHRRAMRDLR